MDGRKQELKGPRTFRLRTDIDTESSTGYLPFRLDWEVGIESISLPVAGVAGCKPEERAAHAGGAWGGGYVTPGFPTFYPLFCSIARVLVVSGVGSERLLGSTLAAVRDPIAVLLEVLRNVLETYAARLVSG